HPTDLCLLCSSFVPLVAFVCASLWLPGLSLDIGSVILNELLHVAMSPASIEVVFLHLGVGLIVAPVVMIEPINGAYHAGAMASTGTVNVKLAGSRIVNQLQKLFDFRRGRVLTIAHRNIHITHSERFGSGLRIIFRIVTQIDDGLNAKGR